MKFWPKVVIALAFLALGGAAFGYWYLETRDAREPSRVAFAENCVSCHGIDLKGSDQAPALVDRELKHGDDLESLMASLQGEVHDWRDQLSPEQIKDLALYVSERRQAFQTTRESYGFRPQEDRLISSQHHDFRLERVATLTSRPYSMAPLPDGRILVAEKTRGLSVVGPDGVQSPLIKDTPEVWDTLISFQGTWVNLGIVLDVALHPDYDNNGWIYLSHTDRCWLECGFPVPMTMVRVVRGRIDGDRWVDQQVIWSVDHKHYTPVPDGVAAGRLAFDKQGYIYVSIGGKNTYDKLHQLDTPFGKIHRVHDDGRIPDDNPFWQPEEERAEGSTRHTVWSYGHRTGQGLEGHPITGAIWNSEMGPRGGDEINLIEAGGNFGWPLYTNGLDYDGERITIGEDLGLDFPIEDTVLPVVDLSPAPAVSNLTFNNGPAFPKWQNDILMGSLKAGTLYRIRIEQNEAVEQEKLLINFGRMRDVAVDRQGIVYVLIEHGDDGSLWRLSPTD